MASFVKKAIPNEGFIEKVYIDTSLTKDEVVEFFSNYNYFQTVEYNGETCYTWGIYAIDENNYLSYAIDMHIDNVFHLVLAKDGVEHKIFDSQTGWSEEILSNNEIVVNNNAIKHIKSGGVLNIYFGYNNEEWKNLFYIKGKALKFKELKTKSSNNYDGNVVPNTGNIENVYINTNLSVEEVVNAIESANLTYDEEGFYYVVMKQNDDDIILSVINLDNNYYILGINASYEMTPIFSTSIFTDMGFDFIGWNSKFNGVYEFNDTASSSVGAENYKLTNLFSSKPFTKDVGDVIETSELPSVGATVVPNTGMVEKVYFNTNLSVEEVVSLCTPYLTNDGYYIYLSNSDLSNTKGISIANQTIDNEKILTIGFLDSSSFNIIPIFAQKDCSLIGTIFNKGWNNSVIEINDNAISSIVVGEETINVGNYNNELSSLFSTTPFTSGVGANDIYKIPRKFTDLYIYGENVRGLLSETYKILDTEIVETKPTSNIVESTSPTDGFYLYYITSENDVFAYLDMGAGATWYNASSLIEFSGIPGLTFKGETEDGSEITEYGYYAYFEKERLYKYENEWVEVVDTRDADATSEDILIGKTAYVNGQKVVGTMEEYNGEQSGGTTYPSGNIDITENGVHNVKEYETATVQIPDVVVKTSGGTAVPNTGYVEKVYFNTNLSVEEVVSLLNNVSSDGMSFIYTTADMSNAAAASIDDISDVEGWNINVMQNGEQSYIFSEVEYQGFTGWNPDFSGIIEVNSEVVNEFNGMSVGDQNEALSNLFSTTPFGSGDGKVLSGEYDGSTISINENQTIDISSMLDEKKLPLEIDVNVPIPNGYIIPSGTLEVTENGTHNVSEYESVSVNVASSGGTDYLGELISKKTNLNYFFQGYTGDNIDFFTYDTSHMKGMSFMCFKCSNLTRVPQFDTSNVTDMSYMFNSCSMLEIIDITYYNISSTSYSSYFAYNCTALKALIIREFGAEYVLNTNSLQNSGIARGTGYIYVPSAMVDTLKSATNWSTYADQIRALEDYTVDGTTTGALDETKI